MKSTFMVKGRNFEILASINTEVYQGYEAYFEAATKVMEFLYRNAINLCIVDKLFDANGNQIFFPQGLEMKKWKESEGYLPPPEWNEYLLIRGVCDEDFTAVKTEEVLKNAGLMEWVSEISRVVEQESVES